MIRSYIDDFAGAPDVVNLVESAGADAGRAGRAACARCGRT